MAGDAYEWGQWRFEPAECRLLREGAVVSLHAKTLDLLAMLLRRAPRLVTKDEILATVWTDAAVEEGNIAFHVAAIRKAIDGDSVESAIETVCGRGYRFVHPFFVRELQPTDEFRRALTTLPCEPVSSAAVAAPPPTESASSAQSPRRRLTGWVTAIGVATIGVLAFFWGRPVAPSTTVAVLRFEMLETSPGQFSLSDGLDAYLTSRFGVIGVPVAPAETEDALLWGTIQPNALGFRVTARLRSRTGGTQLWEWTYDQTADERKPIPGAGPDDERSRIQGLIAEHVGDGVQRYLSLSGGAPVTR